MNSIELETDAPKLRRRSNADVVDRVAVRGAMAELVRGIEKLQHETVFLKAQVARHPAAQGEFMPRIVTLGQSVNTACANFETVVATLSERQQAHSRVEDIRRTLSALRARVPRLPD
jgi:hypothetical protein